MRHNSTKAHAQVGEWNDMRMGALCTRQWQQRRAEAAAEAEAAHHGALIEDHRAVVEAPPWGSARPRLEPGSHRLEARR